MEEVGTDHKFKNKLPFDFYIKKYNLCIEYDGEQHFIKKSFNMDEEEFLLIKKRDEIKNNFCKKNKINLIRIHFTEQKNIDNILKDYFNDKDNKES